MIVSEKQNSTTGRILAPLNRRYSPESPLNNPRMFLRDSFNDLLACRGLAYRLMVRDIKAQYRLSLLGYLWAVFPPIVLALTFVLLRSSNTIQIGETGIPYAAYALIGAVLWQSFCDGLNNPLKVVAQSQQMLVKINFPREALLLSALGQACFSTMVRLGVLIPVLIGYEIWGGWGMVLFPFGIVALLLLGLGFGTLLVPLGALYQDISYGLTVFLGLWMFATPAILPMAETGLMKWIMELNPVSPVLVTARDWMTGQPPELLPGFITVFSITLIGLALGWLLFRIALPHLIARLGM